MFGLLMFFLIVWVVVAVLGFTIHGLIRLALASDIGAGLARG